MSDYLDDCHVNALRYNEAENLYTISDRSSTIFTVKRSGEVTWRLSDVVSNATYGGIQHGHHLLENTLLVFANQAENRRSMVYEFNRSDGAVANVFDGGEYTNTFGSAQRLPGGNTLVTYSNAGAISEFDTDGIEVMTLQTDPIGYATWRADLYGPPSDVTAY